MRLKRIFTYFHVFDDWILATVVHMHAIIAYEVPGAHIYWSHFKAYEIRWILPYSLCKSVSEQIKYGWLHLCPICTLICERTRFRLQTDTCQPTILNNSSKIFALKYVFQTIGKKVAHSLVGSQATHDAIDGRILQAHHLTICALIDQIAQTFQCLDNNRRVIDILIMVANVSDI